MTEEEFYGKAISLDDPNFLERFKEAQNEE